jgi:hypothetical protein
MSYTYNEPTGGVFGDDVSRVRYLLSDKTPAAPFSLSDGEIQYELTAAAGNVNLAAASVAYKMGQAYTRQATTSKSVGDLSLSRNYSGVAQSFFALSDELRSGRATNGITASGFFVADQPIEPAFYVGQFDYE